MSVDELKSAVAGWKTDSGMTVEAILQQEGAPSMNDRQLILLLGELANPSRLADIRAGTMPVKSTSESMISVARGRTRLTFPENDASGCPSPSLLLSNAWMVGRRHILGLQPCRKIRQLVEHLDDRSRSKWKPGNLAEARSTCFA